jgi:hypothetical protein
LKVNQLTHFNLEILRGSFQLISKTAMFFKILLIIFNSILLSIYYADAKLLNTENYHKDGWIYFLYAFVYDLMLLILLIGGILKDKLLAYLILITFLLQNTVITFMPREVPIYGMYLNIFLIILTFLSIFYKKGNVNDTT